jgi:hypothetical protein
MLSLQQAVPRNAGLLWGCGLVAHARFLQGIVLTLVILATLAVESIWVISR